MNRGRFVAALVTTAIAVGAVPGTAHADPAGPSDYRSEIVSVSPPTSTISLSIEGGDSFVRVAVDAGVEVVVIGYDDEPYLRIAPDGTVFENERSRAAYYNDTRYGTTAVPDTVDSEAEPDWQRVGSGGAWAWHDHRAHWMGTEPPVGMQPGDQLPAERIPLLVDGRRVEVEVIATLVAGPSLVPSLLGALAGAVIGALVLRRRRSSIPIVALAAGAGALGVGLAQFSSLPAETGPSPIWWLAPTIAVVCAGAAIVWRQRESRRQRPRRRRRVAGARLGRGQTAHVRPPGAADVAAGLGRPCGERGSRFRGRDGADRGAARRRDDAGSGGQRLVDRGLERILIHGAEVAFDDRAVGIDDHGDRHVGGLQLGRHLALGVEVLLVGGTDLAEELGRLRCLLADVDAHEPHRVAARLVDRFEVGDLEPARGAPGGPQVDHRRALDVAQRHDRATRERGDRHVGQRVIGATPAAAGTEQGDDRREPTATRKRENEVMSRRSTRGARRFRRSSVPRGTRRHRSLAGGEHVDAVVGDEHRVLELGGALAVGGDGGPVVVPRSRAARRRG